MTTDHDLQDIPPLRIEAAYSGDKLIGYTLATSGTEGTNRCLVWVDQAAMPGIRLGDHFVPCFGEQIEYRPVPLEAPAQPAAPQGGAYAEPSRAEFEAEWRRVTGEKAYLWSEMWRQHKEGPVPANLSDLYFSRSTQNGWLIWQAALRASHGQAPAVALRALHVALAALHTCRTGGYTDVDGDFQRTQSFNDTAVDAAVKAVYAALAEPRPDCAPTAPAATPQADSQHASLAASAGSEPVAAIYQLSPPASAHDTITEVIKELRTYNPQADEHGGRFIHKGWANQLEAVAPPQISESDAAYWVRNRALILRAIEERGFRLVSSGGLFWLSGPSHPSPPEGAGWRWVPIEPTEEMLAAAHDGDREYTLRNFGDVMTVMQGPYDHWAAMIAAAPPASEAKGA